MNLFWTIGTGVYTTPSTSSCESKYVGIVVGYNPGPSCSDVAPEQYDRGMDDERFEQTLTRSKDDSIPYHDIIRIWRTTNTDRRIIGESLEVSD